MLSALDVIEGTHTEELQAGGLWWRVRRVTSDDVITRRAALLMLVMPRSEAERVEEEAIAEQPEAERADAMARLRVARFQRNLAADPAIRDRLTAGRVAIICAGVEAASVDRVTWDAVTLVPTEVEHDRTAARIWIGRLNTTAQDALFGAIWDLCTDGGAAVDRIERFRRRAGDV